MESILSAEDEARANYLLYKRIAIAIQDLNYANHFILILQKNDLFSHQWERKWTVYHRQVAFTISMVVSYCRPFTKSKGLPNIPKKLIPFNRLQWKLHHKIIDNRNQLFAHSDGHRYEIKASTTFDIWKLPSFRVNKTDAARLRTMINKLLKQFEKHQINFKATLDNVDAEWL